MLRSARLGECLSRTGPAARSCWGSWDLLGSLRFSVCGDRRLSRTFLCANHAVITVCSREVANPPFPTQLCIFNSIEGIASLLLEVIQIAKVVILILVVFREI